MEGRAGTPMAVAHAGVRTLSRASFHRLVVQAAPLAPVSRPSSNASLASSASYENPLLPPDRARKLVFMVSEETPSRYWDFRPPHRNDVLRLERAKKRVRDDASEDVSDDASEDREILPEAPDSPRPPEDRLTPKEFFLKFVQRTEAQCEAEESAPQGTEPWHRARMHTASGSLFAKCAGLSDHGSREDVAVKKLWGDSFDAMSRAAMAWGSAMEPNARDTYVEWALAELRKEYVARGKNPDEAWLRVDERGILRFADRSWMAYSPDGIVVWRDPDGTEKRRLLEIKCPFHLWNRTHHPYKRHPQYLPVDYKMQIQGGMGHFFLQDQRLATAGKQPQWEIDHADFVVWTPRRFWVTRFLFDKDLFSKQLYPKLQDWYFRLYLPAATAQYNGLLVPGTLRVKRVQGERAPNDLTRYMRPKTDDQSDPESVGTP